MAGYDSSRRYHAYLLRCWEERGEQQLSRPVWRFSLEDPQTGTRLGFASLERLFAFLDGQTSGVSRAKTDLVCTDDGANEH